MFKKAIETRAKRIMSKATALGFTIVPRHVIGGPGYFAPSDMMPDASWNVPSPVSVLNSTVSAAMRPSALVKTTLPLATSWLVSE